MATTYHQPVHTNESDEHCPEDNMVDKPSGRRRRRKRYSNNKKAKANRSVQCEVETMETTYHQPVHTNESDEHPPEDNMEDKPSGRRRRRKRYLNNKKAKANRSLQCEVETMETTYHQPVHTNESDEHPPEDNMEDKPSGRRRRRKRYLNNKKAKANRSLQCEVETMETISPQPAHTNDPDAHGDNANRVNLRSISSSSFLKLAAAATTTTAAETATKKKMIMGITSQGTSQWCKGNLRPIIKPKAYFIHPKRSLPEGYNTFKDVFMNPENISRFILPLVCGDELEFILGDRDKEKPMARKVHVSQYSGYRAYPALKEYLENFREILESSDRNQALVETLPNTAMWSYLGSVNFTKTNETEAYIIDLLRLLTKVLEFGKPYKTLLTEMMNNVLQGTLFQSTSKTGLPAITRSCFLIDTDENCENDLQTSISQIVPRFCQDTLHYVPHVSRALLPTIHAISETTPTKTQRFLYDLLSTTLIGGNSYAPNMDVWQELPLIPRNEELAGDLIEKDKHLSPVKSKEPYGSAEEYMDTYFRLLRAETFSAIQRGIKDLKAMKLNPRDMNVYYNVHVAGYEINNSRFSLAIHFTPAKKVKKWEASPQLMYGNLLCISPNRTFDDVIWTTVSNRDPELLKSSQIIMVELIDYNRKSTSQVIASLQAHGGTSVMVESPTYFHALGPVLSSLKAFDIEGFPFQQEIVNVRFQPDLPGYLEHSETLDTSGVSTRASTICNNIEEDNLGGEMEVHNFLQTFNRNSRTTLEASQCDAMIHALKSRLAIIQGPPGCGKTFIGVKIVQLLLSLRPKLAKPILLLTYKNHALDEFLKHMLDFCRKTDLVRIGGRSKEPELDTCNLQSIMKNEKCATAQFVEIQETENEIEKLASQINDMCGAVDSSCYFTRETLVDELSDEQVQSLLLEAGWNKTQPVYRVNAKTFAHRDWIQRLLVNITNEFGSLKAFLIQCIHSVAPKRNQNDAWHCYQLFEKALEMWFPDKTELQRLKRFQAEYIFEIRKAIEQEKAEEDGSEKSDDDDDEDGDCDEEYVKELLEARMTPITRQGEKRRAVNIQFFDILKKKSQEILIKLSDYPANKETSPHILSIKNVWSLNKIGRMQFLYFLLKEKALNVSRELDELLEQLSTLKSRKQELEMHQKVSILSAKKIIGVTITGASIHHDVIHNIGPSIVIVEEAAEILEPSLLAALTPDIEHLILIGDHQQLRPQVNTWELRKTYRFHVSMMERLINSGFPFKSLIKQNRMRPEFAALLKDIYPRLENNVELVKKNKSLKCLEKSMFFWSHDDLEVKDRTFTNVKEAERVVSLVLYFLNNGCQPSEITVLSAYLGQSKLLRSMLKKEKARRQELFQDSDQPDGFVQVQTIDMFQGDENKYIVASLVRSNSDNNIGFLNEINRRCVAQSRAKCGMYFVGNAATLVQAKGSCWRVLIKQMMEQDCVSNAIPLQCPKHRELSRFRAVDAQGVLAIVDHPEHLCKQRCDDQLPCNIPGHKCKEQCFTKHSHRKCSLEVRDRFSGCGHLVKRKCYQQMSTLLCQVELTIVGLPCGHKTSKKCYMKISDTQCDIMVDVVLPRCGHQVKKECHKKIEDVSCILQCPKTNTCGRHKCPEVCGKSHDHNNCPTMIEYKFPRCGHSSPKKKRCSEIITWKCSAKVYFKGACGHDNTKLCHLKQSEVTCPFTPCSRPRKCGHPCLNACGEDCEKGDCISCGGIFIEKMKQYHEKAMQRVKELERKISKKEVPIFSRDPIDKRGDTAAVYQKVEDQVMKFIQTRHKWYPAVTKIEKVTNLLLQKKFETAKSKAFGDNIDTKFHGTDDAGIVGITKNGFRMPAAEPPEGMTPGMYGQGIYFATDSSKSAQKIYTKGSQKLLLCEVILGKSKMVTKADHTLNKEKLQSQGYDSVFAPRGTAVKNDEFVIFNPDQAFPRYIIHFINTYVAHPLQSLLPTGQRFHIQNVVVSRTVDFNDQVSTYYRIAEAHFMKMSAKGQRLRTQQATIKSIDIVINLDLEDKFEAKKRSFKKNRIRDQEILAYHGTDATHVDSILKNNLQLKCAKRQAYGQGNYFSEYPGISIPYGNALLLCRILPGREYIDWGPENIPPNYNSKKVLYPTDGVVGTDDSGQMIIIEDSDQILPFFVIHL